jgi:hypothetical protein
MQRGFGFQGFGFNRPNSGPLMARWWTTGAKLDADFANNRYFHNGRVWGDETAFLNAVSGTKSGITRTIGPYVDPTATNLLTNGDFASGTTGWAASGTGASIANVGGEGELTSGTGIGNIVQGIAGLGADAFRFRYTSRNGTSTSQRIGIVSVNSTLNGGSYFGPSENGTSNSTNDVIASAVASTMYFGVRKSDGASGAGTHYIDNVSVVRVWPFLGFTQGSFSVAVTATCHAGAVADEVLLQIDGSNERDRVRIVRLVADDTVHVIFTYNNSEVANLDLGAVADGAQFSVSLSGATNAFSASLNGGAPVTDTSGTCPNFGYLRIGRSFTGNTWTGTIERVTVL